MSRKEKAKQRPLALNTVEMLRVASAALGKFRPQKCKKSPSSSLLCILPQFSFLLSFWAKKANERRNKGLRCFWAESGGGGAGEGVEQDGQTVEQI